MRTHTRHDGDVKRARADIYAQGFRGDDKEDAPPPPPREEKAEGGEEVPPDGPDIHSEGIGEVVDWDALFAGEEGQEEWLLKPLLPLGRQVHITARAGTGKSQFSLWMAAGLATGRELFGSSRSPIKVTYVDWEMTKKELAGRLDEMGYGPEDADLLKQNLHYVLHPHCDPLDTAPGGDALVAEVKKAGSQAVFIDTMAGAVKGEENDSDTYRRFAAHTRSKLRSMDLTLVTIDHTGKDGTLGPRGSSQKVGDVDVAWMMELTDTPIGFRLRSTGTGAKNRMQSWVPKTAEIHWTKDYNDVVGYCLPPGSEPGWPAGTAEKADLLDRLGAPLDISKRAAQILLKEHNERCKGAVLVAAIRFRRERAEAGTTPGTTIFGSGSHDAGNHSGTTSTENGKTAGQRQGTTQGTTGEPETPSGGSQWFPPEGGNHTERFTSDTLIDGPFADTVVIDATDDPFLQAADEYDAARRAQAHP